MPDELPTLCFIVEVEAPPDETPHLRDAFTEAAAAMGFKAEAYRHEAGEEPESSLTHDEYIARFGRR